MKPNQCPSTLKIKLTEQAARLMAEKFKKTSINGYQRAYCCQFCDAWHITHHRNKLTKH